MKTYTGYRRVEHDWEGKPTCSTCMVEVHTRRRRRPLRLRLDIRCHSPTGFEWGYGGSGPAQLALALVADACGRKYAVAPIYQRVKAAIVAGLPHAGWTLTQGQVILAVEAAKRQAESVTGQA
jgi:uncharacterized protein DUF6166